MASTPGDRLDSWKEIAAYLNRSVRTVRRWEHAEGLPVHRHLHQTLGSVYAHKSEIDAWRQNAAPAASTDDAKSIAVLPFANVSTYRENDYFADGLTEEIIATLSRLHALRVTSRTSSSRFRDASVGAKTIATQLGVRYLLEGSVRRDGNRVRITVQLIDAPADDHLWAETYDGSIEDVFAIQERVARTIADALRLRLSSVEQTRLVSPAAMNVDAYERYLRARHEAWRWRKDAIDRAVELLHEAIALAGDDARLYAALGFASLQYREAGIDLTDHPLAEAEACAAKVFALDPASAAGFQLRGWLRYSRAQIQEAIHDLKAALTIEPNHADSLLLLSNCYLISGKVPTARPLLDRLLAIDPLTPMTRCMPAFADILEGKLEGTIEPYRQMFEMDPANPVARLFYVWVLAMHGRTTELRPLVEGFAPEVRDTPPARLAFFLAYAASGDRDAAESFVTRALREVANAIEFFARLLGEGYALLGQSDEAIRWLEVAVSRGFSNHTFLAEHDRALSSLRASAPFKQLVEKARARSNAIDV